MNHYSIDQYRKSEVTTRNGHCKASAEWVQVLELDASGTASALRQADQKWPGKLHRAQLVRPRLGATLSQADRNDIHAMTTQTI